MPDIFKWIRTAGAMQAAEFAQSMYTLIQRKPESLVIQRLGINLPAQTVRVEFSQYGREANDRTSNTNVRSRDIMVYGVKDHPGLLVDGELVAIPDTDIRTGDIFNLDGKLFRVTDVYRNPGQLEAEGIAIS